MERTSIRNKYKNKQNNLKISENNNNKEGNDSKEIEQKNQDTIKTNNLSKNKINKKENTNNNKINKDDNIKKDKSKKKIKIKKISPETSSLMSSYKNDIENVLLTTVTNYNNIKEDQKIQQMIKLLQIMKLCNTMNMIKNDKNAIEIIPHLYLGSMACASNLEELKSKNITHILCCGSGIKLYFPDKFKYHKIELADKETEPIRKYFDETYNFINDAIENGGNVLVHCYAGISRSTSIVIAYLMKSKKIGFNKAFELIKEKRGKIQPNSGFVLQLKAYEKELGL